MSVLDLLMRWTHVGTVIVLAGGAVFLRFVLGPAAAKLPDEHHAALRASVMGTWKRFVHGGILLLLVSGFYNYFRGMAPHAGQTLYHPLIGTKILLAFFVFIIASALVGRSAAFERMRAATKLWQTILIVLIGLIVLLSGYVKMRVPPLPAADVQQPAPE